MLGKASVGILPVGILLLVNKYKDLLPGQIQNVFGGFVSKKEPEETALFTHTNEELHCMDRELAHPCVKELRDHLEFNTTEATHTALGCVREVLHKSDDYWVLKNMTHLLLDLDVNVHVFDGNGLTRDNEFVMMGIEYARKLMRNHDCMREFDTKSHLQCRCVPLMGKLSMLKLKNAGRVKEAEDIFNDLKQLEWKGEKNQFAAGEAIAWDGFTHTPQIWLPGLRSKVVWPRETWKDAPLPMAFVLEENFETIQDEVSKAIAAEAPEDWDDTYRFLYEKGKWSQMLLYSGRKFTEECEKIFPAICALMKQNLPSKPGVPWTSDQNEQVLVLRLAKGSSVEMHSGPANNILNIHLGISGLEGANLTVDGQDFIWEKGKVIAWDGSYDHSIDCLKCTANERVIMMVRYMHPDTTADHFKGVDRTQFEDVQFDPLEHEH